MTRMIFRELASAWLAALVCFAGTTAQSGTASAHESVPDNPILEWNQIFIDTLIATTYPNAASPRVGAIVHTAIFDAYNGIERRYTPIFVRPGALRGASRQAAVIAAAHTTLVGLFPTRQAELDASFENSLAKLDNVGHGSRARERAMAWQARQRGIDWGTKVGLAVLAWRAEDGFSPTYPAFAGGMAIGQWRPVPPATAMSSQSMAFTEMFVLASNTQFRPAALRGLTSAAYTYDFNTVKALGRKTGSTRTEDQTELAPFWEGNASIHWNQAANQIASRDCLSMAATARLLAVLNIAMADTVFTIWSAKRSNGEDPGVVTWRPATSIPLAGIDGNPHTIADADWTPLMTTPSHPEYPAGHPSLNGSAATVLLSVFGDRQKFTLTTAGLPSRTYTSITQARVDGNNARVWGGMHYPSSVAISDEVGRRIARYVDRNSMQRLKRH